MVGGLSREAAEKEVTPWFSQLKQQFYQSNRFANHELTQQPLAFIYFLCIEDKDPLAAVELLRTIEHLPHQYRNGAYDNSNGNLKSFVFILNDSTDENLFGTFKKKLTGQFSDKLIFEIKMSVPKS